MIGSKLLGFQLSGLKTVWLFGAITISQSNLRRGQVGTIVETLAGGAAFAVEIFLSRVC